jgi:hypothetical protein
LIGNSGFYKKDIEQWQGEIQALQNKLQNPIKDYYEYKYGPLANLVFLVDEQYGF